MGHGKGFNINYNNLVDELYDQGITYSRVFSVALGTKDAGNRGTVIFGGIDTKKYSGNLIELRNLPRQKEHGRTGPYR